MRNVVKFEKFNHADDLVIEHNEIDDLVYRYLSFDDELIYEDAIGEVVKNKLFKLFGRYKVGGKFWNKRKTSREAKEKIDNIISKASNASLKNVYDAVQNIAPDFPNNEKRITFLRGILMYSLLYDSIVAATKKDSSDPTYMNPVVANEIIEDMREVIKKYIDVDLLSGYTVAENLSQQEILEIEREDRLNEEFIGALVRGAKRLKDKAMDKLFGAEKGSNQPQKQTNTASAKFQKTRGSGAIETERGKTLASNKLPALLMAAGAALGAYSWIVNTEWFKNLFTTITEENYIKMIEQKSIDIKSIKDGDGVYKFLQATTGIKLDGIQGPESLVEALTQVGSGDPDKGVDLLCQKGGVMMNPEKAAEALHDFISDPSKFENLGEFFKGGSTGTGKLVPVDTTLFGTVSGGKMITTITKMIPKVITQKVTKTSAMYYVLKAFGPIALKLGITAFTAGALVKLAREKGKRQSRYKNLDDLLQSLVLVPVPEKVKQDPKPVQEEPDPIGGKTPKPPVEEPDPIGGKTPKPPVQEEPDPIGGKTPKPPVEGGENLTESSVYPIMIKNLTALKNILIYYKGVKIEGEEDNIDSDEEAGDDRREERRKGNITKKGDTRGNAVLRPKTKEGVKEGSDVFRLLKSYEQFILEKDNFGKNQFATINKSESHLVQAFTKLRNSIRVLKDKKDKGYGITVGFLTEIIDAKMDEKETIKKLYQEIWEHVRGKYKDTMPNFGELYKESLEDIRNSRSRKIVAEKIARFSLRTKQFEKQGLYGGMAKLGDYVEIFNQTMTQVLDYYSK